jgi:hypothetical protein
VHAFLDALTLAFARRRARRTLRQGRVYRHPIETPAGTLRAWATVDIDGSTLILRDVGVYPERPGETARFEYGIRELARLRDVVATTAALAGFEHLRIAGVRTDRIRGEGGHPLVDIDVDLAPYRQ